jgi:hypothetical protein
MGCCEMSKCPHCAVTKGPAIRELRRDAFNEAVKLMQGAGMEIDFDQAMTLACFIIGMGEEDEDE